MLSEVRKRLKQDFPGAEVAVEGDEKRLAITVVSEMFEGLSRVKRQQAVYACVADLIKDGRLHAVSIRASTPSERATSE